MATRRWEAALRDSADWHTAATLDELARRTCSLLLRLIPADGAAWNEIDRERRSVRIVAEPLDHQPPDVAPRAAPIHGNPLVERVAALAPGAHSLSELVDAREFYRRQIYRDVYQWAGVEEQLALLFEVEDGGLIAIALNRGARQFDAEERRLLDVLWPHAARAHAAIRARDDGQRRLEALERGLAAAGRHVAVLGPAGSIADARLETRRLVARWFPGGRPLPGRHVGDGAELTVRFVAGDPPLLLLDERRTAPPPGRARALGLTEREAEVVVLAGRGLDDSGIAAELVLSPRTVQKHLEHAFGKLAVHSRAEAARRLLDGCA